MTKHSFAPRSVASLGDSFDRLIAWKTPILGRPWLFRRSIVLEFERAASRALVRFSDSVNSLDIVEVARHSHDHPRFLCRDGDVERFQTWVEGVLEAWNVGPLSAENLTFLIRPRDRSNDLGPNEDTKRVMREEAVGFLKNEKSLSLRQTAHSRMASSQTSGMDLLFPDLVAHELRDLARRLVRRESQNGLKSMVVQLDMPSSHHARLTACKELEAAIQNRAIPGGAQI